MGGHEFSRRRGNEALRDYMLGLLDSPRPRICLLPTASGDPSEQIAAFGRSLGDLACETSHLSLFRLETQRVSVREHLLGQDMIYVGGGSMLNLLAVWQTHGIDRILREAWERGTLLCGQSAGAMCWFEYGITRSAGTADPRPGLGMLAGSLCVHYHQDPVRRRAFREAVGFGFPPGYALDDHAGLLFRGTELAEAVSARSEAGAWRVEPADGARSHEIPLEARALADPRPAIDEPTAELVELRHTRAARTARAPR